jgi:predicted acyltransferase
MAAGTSTIMNKDRFLSLDIFRGLTICLMIIVNSPGKGASLYPYLVHAKWLGFTLADLVFPSFMFAVGNAMSFSMQGDAFISQGDFLKKIFTRTILVFLIGYLMYWFPFVHLDADGGWVIKPFSETRVMGVLQRIALAYCCAALLIHYFSSRQVLFISGFLLLAYWAALYLFGDAGQELTIGGNAIKKFDLLLLSEGHIYKKDAMPFDPEGILSTLPSIVNVIAGYLAGNFIRQKGKTYECLVKLMVVGVMLVSLALWWGLIFPISKKLWTSSFTLYTIGIDILIISVLVYLIEIRKFEYGTYFFKVFGKNPLFIYLLSELAYVVLVMIKLPSGQSVFEWISKVIFQTIAPGSFGSLLTGIWFMLMCWLAGCWLDKRKIYIKL